MSSLRFGAPSASTSSSSGPINLPPIRDISGLQHRSRHQHNQIRPSEQRSSTSTSTHRQQLPPISSLTSRPDFPSSGTSSFIPTQTGSSFTHWASQDPFDSLPRPRRSVLSARPSLFSNPNRSSVPRRAHSPLPFAPSPPTSQAGIARLPPLQQRQSTPYNFSNQSTTSRASTSSPELATMPASRDNKDMPPPRQTRKRRATNDLTSSSPSESPAPALAPSTLTRNTRRRVTRSSTSSSDRPIVPSSRTAAAQRTPRLRRTTTKPEPVDEPIVFDSDIEEEEPKYKVIDLVDRDEVPEEPEPEKEKNTIKLGTFQCVICMDDVKDLTVTHCGLSYL